MGTVTLLQPCADTARVPMSEYDCWRAKRFFNGVGEQLTKDRSSSQQDLAPSDSMCQIRPKLFLGSEESERNLECLRLMGVSHVLQVGAELKPTHPGQFVYKTLEVFDLPEEDIISQLSTCFPFIEEAMQTGTVLVHCQLGVSRSAAVVIAYLMWSEHLLYKDAKEDVQTARPFISLNYGFCLQLCQLEEISCDLTRWQGWNAQLLALAKSRPVGNAFSRKRSMSCSTLVDQHAGMSRIHSVPFLGINEHAQDDTDTAIPDASNRLLNRHSSDLSHLVQTAVARTGHLEALNL